uniref:Uncharacterized protein n=1 Tax=Rhizophagus irregularis (strain DAOM 181602 / DAOM 197198 / MUCL 43194) TaxID=747089 RepID=U9TXM7_RHIID
MHSQKKRRMNSYHSTRNLECLTLIIDIDRKNRILENWDLRNKNSRNWMFQEIV